jgi:hypothetical protein
MQEYSVRSPFGDPVYGDDFSAVGKFNAHHPGMTAGPNSHQILDSPYLMSIIIIDIRAHNFTYIVFWGFKGKNAFLFG